MKTNIRVCLFSMLLALLNACTFLTPAEELPPPEVDGKPLSALFFLGLDKRYEHVETEDGLRVLIHPENPEVQELEEFKELAKQAFDDVNRIFEDEAQLLDDADRLDIIVPREFKQDLGHKTIDHAGAALMAWSVPRILVGRKNANGKELPRELMLRHEMVHVLQAQVLESLQPRWHLEGFADFAACFDEGGWNEHRAKQLLQVGPRAYAGLRYMVAGQHYAAAWSKFFYLHKKEGWTLQQLLHGDSEEIATVSPDATFSFIKQEYAARHAASHVATSREE